MSVIINSKSTFSFELYNIYSDEDIEAYFLDKDSEYNGLIVCSVHGNESLGFQVVKDLIYDQHYFPEDFNYIIVLQPSKYRIRNSKRTNFEGLDPNRTYLNLYSKSSVFIVKIMNKYKPVFILDIHQTKNKENDFMYSFGNFCKILKNIYQVDNFYKTSTYTIYLPEYYELMSLQKKLENKSEELFCSLNIKVSKYKAFNKEDSYDRVSILRNFSAAKGIFSVLFEFPYSQNNRKNLESILKQYLIFLGKYKEDLKKYTLISKKIEKIYFGGRYFVIPSYYESIDKLISLLNTFEIDYYFNMFNLYSLQGLYIQEINIRDLPEFRGFVYLDPKIKIEQIFDQKEITKNKFIIIKQNVVNSYLLNPIYGESIWNFGVVPYSKNCLPLYIYVRKN